MLTMLVAASSLAIASPDSIGIKADTPVLLAPGVLSTKQGEFSPTLDPERGELFFMRRTPGRFDYKIFVSRRDAGGWTTPEPAPFSTGSRDAGPSLSPDGNTLVFDSRAPAPGLAPRSINLWTTERLADGWSEPALIRAASANAPDDDIAEVDEFGPLLDAEGTLYFYSFRPPHRGGRHYRVRAGAPAEVLEAPDLPDPSASTFVGYLTLSPDSTLAVIEGRSRTGRDTDLFLARRDETGAWSDPEPIDAVNTRFNDGTPYLTPDGRSLLFASTRPTTDALAGNSNLYIIETSAFLPDR
jgi:hypothetical protein